MGGGGGGAAAYRNGDVVGHNASEIPASNFGRKLMEKMGWAAGNCQVRQGWALFVMFRHDYHDRAFTLFGHCISRLHT
ncbi:hypothetical protein KCU98_g12, partial [Aureobasidium melanogenum]